MIRRATRSRALPLLRVLVVGEKPHRREATGHLDGGVEAEAHQGDAAGGQTPAPMATTASAEFHAMVAYCKRRPWWRSPAAGAEAVR